MNKLEITRFKRAVREMKRVGWADEIINHLETGIWYYETERKVKQKARAIKRARSLAKLRKNKNEKL